MAYSKYIYAYIYIYIYIKFWPRLKKNLYIAKYSQSLSRCLWMNELYIYLALYIDMFMEIHYFHFTILDVGLGSVQFLKESFRHILRIN